MRQAASRLHAAINRSAARSMPCSILWDIRIGKWHMVTARQPSIVLLQGGQGMREAKAGSQSMADNDRIAAANGSAALTAVAAPAIQPAGQDLPKMLQIATGC